MGHLKSKIEMGGRDCCGCGDGAGHDPNCQRAKWALKTARYFGIPILGDGISGGSIFQCERRLHGSLSDDDFCRNLPLCQRLFLADEDFRTILGDETLEETFAFFRTFGVNVDDAGRVSDFVHTLRRKLQFYTRRADFGEDASSTSSDTEGEGEDYDDELWLDITRQLGVNSDRAGYFLEDMTQARELIRPFLHFDRGDQRGISITSLLVRGQKLSDMALLIPAHRTLITDLLWRWWYVAVLLARALRVSKSDDLASLYVYFLRDWKREDKLLKAAILDPVGMRARDCFLTYAMMTSFRRVSDDSSSQRRLFAVDSVAPALQQGREYFRARVCALYRLGQFQECLALLELFERERTALLLERSRSSDEILDDILPLPQRLSALMQVGDKEGLESLLRVIPFRPAFDRFDQIGPKFEVILASLFSNDTFPVSQFLASKSLLRPFTAGYIRHLLTLLYCRSFDRAVQLLSASHFRRMIRGFNPEQALLRPGCLILGRQPEAAYVDLQYALKVFQSAAPTFRKMVGGKFPRMPDIMMVVSKWLFLVPQSKIRQLSPKAMRRLARWALSETVWKGPSAFFYSRLYWGLFLCRHDGSDRRGVEVVEKAMELFPGHPLATIFLMLRNRERAGLGNLVPRLQEACLEGIRMDVDRSLTPMHWLGFMGELQLMFLRFPNLAWRARSLFQLMEDSFSKKLLFFVFSALVPTDFDNFPRRPLDSRLRASSFTGRPQADDQSSRVRNLTFGADWPVVGGRGGLRPTKFTSETFLGFSSDVHAFGDLPAEECTVTETRTNLITEEEQEEEGEIVFRSLSSRSLKRGTAVLVISASRGGVSKKELKYVSHDCQSVAGMMRDLGASEITQVTTTRPDFVRTKTEVLRELTAHFKLERETCVVFFAGHGIAGTGDWDLAEAPVSLEEVAQEWKSIRMIDGDIQGRLFLISGVCYSGEWVERYPSVAGLNIEIQAGCGPERKVQESSGLENSYFVDWWCRDLRRINAALYAKFRREKNPRRGNFWAGLPQLSPPADLRCQPCCSNRGPFRLRGSIGERPKCLVFGPNCPSQDQKFGDGHASELSKGRDASNSGE